MASATRRRPDRPVTSNLPLVGAALAGTSSPAGGYWEVATDGGIFSFGDATFHGSMGGTAAQRARSSAWPPPRTGTATGRWRPTAASSRSATATFHGSMGGTGAQRAHRGHGRHPETANGLLGGRDRRRASSRSATATFHGSMGGQPLNAPIVGMAATPSGERLLGGGVRRRHLLVRRPRPSTGPWAAQALNAPIVGMAPGPPRRRLLGAGRRRRRVLVRRAVLRLARRAAPVDRFFAMVPTPDGGGYLLTGQHPPP